MNSFGFRRGESAKLKRGFTLLELIVATTILSILTLMLLPLARADHSAAEGEGVAAGPVADARCDRQLQAGG